MYQIAFTLSSTSGLIAFHKFHFLPPTLHRFSTKQLRKAFRTQGCLHVAFEGWGEHWARRSSDASQYFFVNRQKPHLDGIFFPNLSSKNDRPHLTNRSFFSTLTNLQLRWQLARCQHIFWIKRSFRVWWERNRRLLRKSQFEARLSARCFIWMYVCSF